MSRNASAAVIEFPARIGRPPALYPTDETLRRIKLYASWHVTREEAAEALGVTRKTLREFMNAHPEADDAWETGLRLAECSIRRAQYKMALRSTKMAIWWGMQFLGQTRRYTHVHKCQCGKALDRAPPTAVTR